MKKISLEWLVVTLVALVGAGCLYASHQMKEDLAQKQTAALEQSAE